MISDDEDEDREDDAWMTEQRNMMQEAEAAADGCV